MTTEPSACEHEMVPLNGSIVVNYYCRKCLMTQAEQQSAELARLRERVRVLEKLNALYIRLSSAENHAGYAEAQYRKEPAATQ